MQVHHAAADAMGEAVDESIRGMSSLIVKCGEVSQNMKPVEDLVVQIKTVKRSLDILEAAFNE